MSKGRADVVGIDSNIHVYELTEHTYLKGVLMYLNGSMGPAI